MTSAELERVALRELLIDSVALPAEAVREAIFARTLAAGPEPTGADLVPPVELFSDAPEGTVGPDGAPGAAR